MYKTVVFLLGAIFTLSFFHPIQAYRQELTLIDTENGKVSTFYLPLPDTSEYNLENVNRVCVTGVWAFYGGEDYSLGYYVIGSGGPAQICEDRRFAFRSFRHLGANETGVDALSLYTGSTPFNGLEIHVETSPWAGNFRSIKSFASTGPSKWTLFEGIHYRFSIVPFNFDREEICTVAMGQPFWVVLSNGSNFDGKSMCWQGSLNPVTGYNFEKSLTKLSTVGSLVKGCNKPTSVEYRDQLRQSWSRIRNVPHGKK